MTARRYTHSRPTPNLATDADDWRELALCAQTDPESFFPNKGQVDLARAAKRLCNGDPKRGVEPCPVRAECLADAISRDDQFGVYGGLGPRERRQIKKGAA